MRYKVNYNNEIARKTETMISFDNYEDAIEEAEKLNKEDSDSVFWVECPIEFWIEEEEKLSLKIIITN